LTSYLFGASAEGFSTTDFAFASGEGSPFPGCMFADGTVTPFDYVQSDKTGVSIPVTIGNPLSFRCRVKGNPPTNPFSLWSVGMVVDGLGTCLKNGADILFTDGDTGWFIVEGSISTNGTVTSVSIRIGGDPSIDDFMTEIYFDSIYIAESPPESGPYDLFQSEGGIPGAVMVTT